MYTPAAIITVDNAHLVLKEGQAAIAAGQYHFDLGTTQTVDSTAVAVLLAWQSSANQHGKTLQLSNVPASLLTLADLYGATGLLQQAA